MADQSLIRGAAAIAQSEAAKSGALGAGLAAGITPVVQEVVKFQEERKKKLDTDAGLAAQYGLRMSKIEGVGPEQRKYLTNLFTKTRDELNQIAKDPDMPSNVKSAMMAELVQKSNDAVSDNAELYGLAADANELLRKVGSEGNLSLSNAFDLNSEEYNIVKGLSADGYTVNNETGEIIIDGKPVDKQKIQNALNIFEENMVNPSASIEARANIIKDFKNAKTEKQAQDIIDINIGALNNANEADVKVMKKILADTFGLSALELKGIKDYKNALNTKFDELKQANFTPVVVEEKIDEPGIGIQYYNLLKENLTDETKLLPFLSRFGISEGAEIDDSLIKSVERTGDGIKIILEKDGETIEDNRNSNELVNLILNNVALTASQAQQLQLKLLQEPIELSEFKKKTPVEKFLNNLGSINIRNPFRRNN